MNDDKPGKTQRDVLRYFGEQRRQDDHRQDRSDRRRGLVRAELHSAQVAGRREHQHLPDRYRPCDGDRQLLREERHGCDPVSVEPGQDPARDPAAGVGSQLAGRQDVCAVVYDSDVSINYDHQTPLGVNGNLQGETLGIVAFHVDQTRTLDGFSSSTLPQVTLTILDTSVCGNWVLFNAPVPAELVGPERPDRARFPDRLPLVSVWLSTAAVLLGATS